MSPPTTEAAAAWARVLEAARQVSRKWQEIRANNRDAPWEDFSFYKGNARWALGALTRLEALDGSRFPSARAACDEARRIVRAYQGDADYDDPDAARDELLLGINAVSPEVGPPVLRVAGSPPPHEASSPHLHEASSLPRRPAEDEASGRPAEEASEREISDEIPIAVYLGIIEKRISLDELQARMGEIIDEIGASGVVYVVEHTATAADEARLLPAGMATGPDSFAFVLGPTAICGRVLGLVDPEYGWPAAIVLADVTSAWDLAPGHRRHPFILPPGLSLEHPKNGDEEKLIVSIMPSEYEEILIRMARERG